MKIVFIIGTSGSGKSYLENKLIISNPSLFKKIRSFTTRSIRSQETGDEYHFISQEQYQSHMDKGEVVQSITFAGNTYGSLLTEYDQDKINVIVVVPNSMNQVLSYFQDKEISYKTIILDKDKSIIEANMIKRGHTQEEINARLEQDDISKQIESANITADIKLVNNDYDLDQIVAELKELKK